MISGVWLVETCVLEAELKAAWEGICYARLILWANRLIVEEDFAKVVACLQSPLDYGVITHP